MKKYTPVQKSFIALGWISVSLQTDRRWALSSWLFPATVLFQQFNDFDIPPFLRIPQGSATVQILWIDVRSFGNQQFSG